jgi:hypothetical protein
VLGVALLVALLGSPTSPGDALDQLRQVWVLCTVSAITSSAISIGHLVGRKVPA